MEPRAASLPCDEPARVERSRTDEQDAVPPGRLVVVTPTLDEAEALPAIAQRVLRAAPDDRADLLVVADGGSTDGTRDLARSAGAELVDAPAGRGLQLQAGASRALELLGEPGPDDLILFQHADNLPDRGSLAALRHAAAEPGPVAFALSQRIGAEGWFYRQVERAADRRAARGLVYGDSSLAVRPAAYLAAGGFAPVPLFEDLDLSMRLARIGPVRLLRQAKVRVDARRWKREGALRTTFRNRILTTLWRLGVSPERLVRWYPRHRPDADDRPARTT